MPVTFRVDPKAGLVWARATGELKDSDLLGLQDALAADPEFDPSFNQLFDFNGVTEVALTSDGVWMLAQRNMFREGARRAFVVAPGDLEVYGMMRMFQILTEKFPDELRVQFNHIEQARAWLGIPED